MQQLTPKQERVFKFLRAYIESNNESPSIEEICERFNLRSPATVHQHLTALERLGLISRVPNVARGIRLIDNHSEQGGHEVPLLGTVAAGAPIEAVLTQEKVWMPNELIGKQPFALRVRGD